MSQKDVISNFLDGLSAIKNLIDKSDIEKCLNNEETALNTSKKFVDEFFELSKKFKNNYYEHYNKLQQKCQIEESVENDTSVPNILHTNGVDPTNELGNNESTSDNLEVGTPHSEILLQSDLIEEGTEIESVNANKTVNVLSENRLATNDISTNSDILSDSNVQENVVKQEIPEEQPRKSLIRLVDLSKLIDPNKKKFVKFDSSVIVLSSSDDETTNVKDTNSSENQAKITNKNKNSGSDDEKEIGKKRKSVRLQTNQKVKTESREKLKTIFKRSKNRSFEIVDKDSRKKSDGAEIASISSSDSETEKSKKSVRTSLSRKCKLDDIKLNKKVYVPLPLFECDKLKEVYNMNKEYFEILSSERIESLRRSKRSRSAVENNSSSDTEKSSKKKFKITDIDSNDKLNRKSKKLSSKQNSEDETDDHSNKKEEVDKEKLDSKETKIKKTSLKNKDDENHLPKKQVRFQTSVNEDTDSDDDKSNKRNSRLKKSPATNGAESDSVDEVKLKKRKLNGKKNVTQLEENSEQSVTNMETKNDVSTEENSDGEKSPKTKPPVGKNNSDNDSAANLNEEKSKKDETENSDDIHPQTSDSKERNEELSSTAEFTSSPQKSNDDNNEPTGEPLNEAGKEEEKIKQNSKNINKKKNEFKEKSKDAGESNKKVKRTKTNKNGNSDSEDKDSDKETSDNCSQSNDKKKSSSNIDINSEEEKDAKTEKEIVSIVESSSESEVEFGAFSKKRDKTVKESISKTKKKILNPLALDSDESNSDKNDKDKDSNSEASNNSDGSQKSSDTEKEKSNKTASRRRIKKTKDSSDSDSDEEISTRKKIREVLGKDALSESTKLAESEEKERKARIAEKQKKYNRIFEEKKDVKIDNVVLDYNEKTKEPILEVHPKIVKNLKPHQASGIQFMFDACFESLERINKSPGSGCILAHCMGLGKTLQVISLIHVLLTNSEKTKVEKVMVVCPVNTVLNWKSEFKKWMPSNSQIDVYELVTSKKNYDRQYNIENWHQDGGVLIIGYNMFRLLSNPTNRKITKKMKTVFLEGLVDPGPDLVICDEGHLLKNEKTNLSIAMNRIKTARRIVLTGTPLQNNLKEYWCMVQFIKPNLLGSYKEYMNRFVNPITNGQYTDSTQHDTILMRKRSHVLHKLLDGVVQRRDYSVLEPYLPPKYEYVLFVKLSQVQTKMYKHYMEKYARQSDGSNRTSFLFTDFQQLQRMCTHPRVLLDKTTEKKEKWDDEDSEGSLKDFIDDGDASSSNSNSSSSNSESGSDNDSDESGKKKKGKTAKSRMTRARAAQKIDNNEEESEPEVELVSKEWWQEYCDGDELDNIKNSGKLSLLFEILKECEEIGDKILVFSQSLYTLNCIEYFLTKIDEATQTEDNDKLGGYKGSWALGLDYFRIDGSSSCDNRAIWCDSFNNPKNIRARLFLISTKAGGLGINLVAANRVIIFDVSWNPSHDIQSIYRVYRFGQIKPSYIYRFVSYGTMEMKIYERQVTKQAISKRVIDEQQIDRHYNQNDLQELYKCDLEPTDKPLPMVPKDVLLGEMLQKYENIIYKYHLHQSLLENKTDEGLNEEERKAAWEEFENEKVLRKTYATTNPYPGQITGGIASMQGYSAQSINAALINIVRRDNPKWSEHQIKGIIPALVRQLQVQIEENDMSMYQRVVQEIQIMNQAKLKESMYQQQMMRLYQQQYMFQKQQQSVLGNLNITPQALQNFFGAQGNFFAGNQQINHGPSTSSNQRPGNDIIELND